MNTRQAGVAATLAGAGLALGGLALGALLMGRDKRRHEHPDSAPGYTARRGFGEYAVTGRSVTINKPRSEIFRFFRDFQNLPTFMENLEAVEPKGDGRNVWKIRGPLDRVFEVETEIVREEQDELIAWRSVDGSQIRTEGRLKLREAPGDRGTQVQLIIAYKPPAGEAGRLIAKLFQREPAVQARHDLKRLKMLLETGEIATSARRRDETRAAKQENH
ncbi:SRPBCC family protein [Qipengyuania thermophila]|uniref:SRPBCC family protein n=1 Tax=Qipengyuania thermophila TaxID=2509361 RepID=UPI001F4873BB|nr:SRPBCC family protein [Qipengyuania thermophila]